jgi:hypothetical protein
MVAVVILAVNLVMSILVARLSVSMVFFLAVLSAFQAVSTMCRGVIAVGRTRAQALAVAELLQDSVIT